MSEGLKKKYTGGEISYFEQRKITTQRLRKGGALYTEAGRLEVTAAQRKNAHKEMEEELSKKQDIVDNLKDAQPGDPEFESFVLYNARLHLGKYRDNPDIAIKTDDLSEEMSQRGKLDSEFHRALQKNSRLGENYYYKLDKKTNSLDGSYRLYTKKMKEIKDQKIAELRRQPQNPQTMKERGQAYIQKMIKQVLTRASSLAINLKDIEARTIFRYGESAAIEVAREVAEKGKISLTARLVESAESLPVSEKGEILAQAYENAAVKTESFAKLYGNKYMDDEYQKKEHLRIAQELRRAAKRSQSQVPEVNPNPSETTPQK